MISTSSIVEWKALSTWHNGYVTRIIAGKASGHRLATLSGDQTRPTSDRVREALFSSLSSWLGATGDKPLAEIAFADLFAGSGAVGLEAASRGAKPVLLVESSRPAVNIIEKNLAKTGLAATVATATVLNITSKPPGQAFDVVFLDPPYLVPNTEVEIVLSQLIDNGWLGENALVVVERSSRTEAVNWPMALENSWTKRYGETTLYFAQF